MKDPVHRLHLRRPDPVVAVGAPVVRVVRRAAAVPDVPVGTGPRVGDQRIVLPLRPAAEVRRAERPVADKTHVLSPSLVDQRPAHGVEHHRIALDPAPGDHLPFEIVGAVLAVLVQVTLRQLLDLMPAEVRGLVVGNEQHQRRVRIHLLELLHRRRVDVLRRRIAPRIDRPEGAQLPDRLTFRRDHGRAGPRRPLAVRLVHQHRFPLGPPKRNRQSQPAAIAEQLAVVVLQSLRRLVIGVGVSAWPAHPWQDVMTPVEQFDLVLRRPAPSLAAHVPVADQRQRTAVGATRRQQRLAPNLLGRPSRRVLGTGRTNGNQPQDNQLHRDATRHVLALSCCPV